MLGNIISAANINFLLVFLEGLLSFLSPCVVPLIPVYMGYLAGNARHINEDGSITYQRSKVLLHTVLFILGISFTFFLLGMSFTAFGAFFKRNQLLFTRIGGVLIIAMGLHQIGLLDFNFLKKEHRINLGSKIKDTNPAAAFLMGFTFSFAWTPCVGTALSSVLILASGAESRLKGYILVLVYTAGFIIPFLLLGFFTTQALNFLKKHQGFLKYTAKLGGLILILIGIMTYTGWMNGISKYLNSFSPQKSAKQSSSAYEDDTKAAASGVSIDTDRPAGKPKTPLIDFTLTDQHGSEHTLSDYKGKVIFLNFWATWCPPCKKEIPDIEELYKEYGENKGDVIFLGVTNPVSKEYPDNADVSKPEITKFLSDNGYTFPTVFDETGDILGRYQISAFPTTFLIDKEGNIYGYAPGAMTKEVMKNVIEQTLKSTE